MQKTGYILFLIIFLFSNCQDKPKEIQEEEETNIEKEEISEKIEIKANNITGKKFVYGLGCSWYSQSETNGFLHFYSPSKFRLRINQSLRESQNPDNLLDLKNKEEIIEGKYTFSVEKQEIRLIFINSKIKIEEHYPKEKTTNESKEFVEDEITVHLGKCDDKISLEFSESVPEIPSEKYYQWVERNYSGNYISYAEGVREEIIIEEKGDTLNMKYLSPSYQKPINLLVKKYEIEARKADISFPNDKDKTYEIYFRQNELSTFTQKDEFQEFTKILNPYTDNPNNLSLAKYKARNGYNVFENKSNLRIDTIAPFKKTKKVKINKVDENEFISNYKPTPYEIKKKKLCLDLDKNKEYENCEKKIETSFLKEGDLVKREGLILIYPLKNNREYFLRDNPAFGESVQKLYYQGVYNSVQGKIFITYGHYWEWQNYRLLHQESGEEILVSNAPYLSLDRKYIIATNNLFLYEMGGVSIQLWEIKPYGFDLIWEFVPTTYIPQRFVWLNNKEILFEASPLNLQNQENREMAYGKIVLPD